MISKKSNNTFLYLGLGIGGTVLAGFLAYQFIPQVKQVVNSVVGSVSGNGSLAAANSSVAKSSSSSSGQTLSSANAAVKAASAIADIGELNPFSIASSKVTNLTGSKTVGDAIGLLNPLNISNDVNFAGDIGNDVSQGWHDVTSWL